MVSQGFGPPLQQMRMPPCEQAQGVLVEMSRSDAVQLSPRLEPPALQPSMTAPREASLRAQTMLSAMQDSLLFALHAVSERQKRPNRRRQHRRQQQQRRGMPPDS